MSRVAIFLCNDRTMAGCFEHQLFGTGDSYGLQVRQGDFCLLYNFDQNQVFGVWKATTDGGNHEPGAWDGQFPNQVRIREYGEIIQIARNGIQALAGIQNIGRIYESDHARNLLRQFGRETEHPDKQPISANATLTKQIEPDYLLLPPKIFCEDTDRVRSQGEKIIDDCLFHLEVRHVYEPTVTTQGGQLIPDFAVYSRSGKPIYIEYWGKLNERDYDERRRAKTRLYKLNNLPLIQIVPDDLRFIRPVLEKELEKWDVSFNEATSRFFDFLVRLFRKVFGHSG